MHTNEKCTSSGITYYKHNDVINHTKIKMMHTVHMNNGINKKVK